jgi:predicted nuclease of predicted toxin-antitoxin system
MRILLDENLPMRLIAALRALGHDVEHVYTKDLSSRPDPDVRAVAEAEQRFLITQDRRFADARIFLAGSHHGVLLVRLKHPGRDALLDRVREMFETSDVESWAGCFVVISESKLRVIRPA